MREDDVYVDFQFVSSRRVDVELRMNLQGDREKHYSVVHVEYKYGKMRED